MDWLVPGGIGLPLFIFVAEVCVVTITTLRTIFIARGMKYAAPPLGFVEVVTWLFAIGEVMKNLNDRRCSLAFAAGFTLGNFLGILIEQRLALGTVMVRAITMRNATDLVDRLRAAAFGATRVEAHGSTGPVQIVLTVVARKELDGVLDIIKSFDPQVFYSVDALKSAGAGVLRSSRRRPLGLFPSAIRLPSLLRLSRPLVR
jgi:uncharacterized protein YebE (UPF0316 family)